MGTHTAQAQTAADHHLKVQACYTWAIGLRAQGEFEEATIVLSYSLRQYRLLADKAGEVKALNQLGAVMLRIGNATQARSYFEQSLTIQRTVGNNSSVRIALHNLAMLTAQIGEYDTAHRFYEQALNVARKTGSWYQQEVIFAS